MYIVTHTHTYIYKYIFVIFIYVIYMCVCVYVRYVDERFIGSFFARSFTIRFKKPLHTPRHKSATRFLLKPRLERAFESPFYGA